MRPEGSERKETRGKGGRSLKARLYAGPWATVHCALPTGSGERARAVCSTGGELGPCVQHRRGARAMCAAGHSGSAGSVLAPTHLLLHKQAPCQPHSKPGWSPGQGRWAHQTVCGNGFAVHCTLENQHKGKRCADSPEKHRLRKAYTDLPWNCFPPPVTHGSPLPHCYTVNIR